MNTNNLDNNGLPDAEYLQKLANEFFAGYPNDYLKPVEQLKQPMSDPLLQQGQKVNVQDPQGNLQSPFGTHDKVPPSVGGLGISPSLLQQNQLEQGIKNPDIKNPQTNFTDPFGPVDSVPRSMSGIGVTPFAFQQSQREPTLQNPLLTQGQKLDMPDPQTGLTNPFGQLDKVPGSMSGLGISPSVVNQNPIDPALLNPLLPGGQKQDEQNPQTNLKDPFGGIENVPPSMSGLGILLSTIEHGQRDPGFRSYLNHDVASIPVDDFTKQSLLHLPYQKDQHFEKELHEVLPPMHPFFSVPQIPADDASSFGGSSFYFLQGKEKAQPAKQTTGSNIPGFENQGQLTTLSRPPFDFNLIKNDFPILRERVNGRPLIWLDNAATTQKPKSVIDRLTYYYEHENSNIHRAAHELAARATDAYEGARKKVQNFINAGSVNEVVFVRGATEAINLVAKSWGEQYLQKGDEIIVSHLEHHANIVPWQMLAEKKGVILKVIPVDDDGQVLLDAYAKLLGPKTRLVSFTHVSNALGTVTPAKRMIEMAHSAGAKVLVDGAQAVSHMRTDVRFLDCDWYVFSGHKVFAPTGIGVLYGKEELLNETQPWQGGGNMIVDVTFEHSEYQKAPSRYEAGTGNIADAIGLGEAVDYVTRIGIDAIQQYEHYLLVYATRLLKEIPGLRLIGTAPDKAGVMSFVLDGFKTEEVGAALNREGIAVRSGHHCAQPILRRFGVESSVRPSLALYNTCSDIDTLIAALHRLVRGKGRTIV